MIVSQSIKRKSPDICSGIVVFRILERCVFDTESSKFTVMIVAPWFINPSLLFDEEKELLVLLSVKMNICASGV